MSRRNSSRRNSSRRNSRNNSRGSRSGSRCPPGQIMRRGYSRTTPNGRRVNVKSGCITSTSYLGDVKRSDIDRRYIASRRRNQESAARKLGSRGSKARCPPGMIARAPFQRRSFRRQSGSRVRSSLVKSGCVRSPNRQKKPTLFHLDRGTLEQYGYGPDVASMSVQARRSALRKAVKDIPPLSVFRKLNAIYLVNRRTNPRVARIFNEDKEFVQQTPEYQNRETANGSRSGSRGSRRGSRSRGSRRGSRTASRQGSRRNSRKGSRRSRRGSRQSRSR